MHKVKPALLEPVTTRLLSDKFRFGSRVFPAVKRANRVNAAENFAVRRKFDERADVRQFAARPAIDALAFAPFGDGQYRRKGSFCFGKPCILIISHNSVFDITVTGGAVKSKCFDKIVSALYLWNDFTIS